jgi:flagellar hook assembly protein FlgD
MIMVYDIVGHEIRTLVNDQQNAGFNSIVWNGKDRFGRTVGTGVYFCRISSEGFIKTRKMILLK